MSATSPLASLTVGPEAAPSPTVRQVIVAAPAAETADAWFVELSAIVRRYLEQRYDIRAPELTTEEFLLVATARPELTADHRRLLTSFLERCDRVKFAGYRPAAGESMATHEAARGFVEDTRLVETAAS